MSLQWRNGQCFVSGGSLDMLRGPFQDLAGLLQDITGLIIGHPTAVTGHVTGHLCHWLRLPGRIIEAARWKIQSQ